MKLILYIHGKDGSLDEAEHYKPLFPDCEVRGLDYKGNTPWEAGPEIEQAVYKAIDEHFWPIEIIANSIGAYFCMHTTVYEVIKKAYFISPIVDMENLIMNMMMWSGVSEEELREKKTISIPFGDDLSWEYLCYVREHKIKWDVNTEVLYGMQDDLTTYETMKKFCAVRNRNLDVMEDGEHWFHTEEQMQYLDNWIRRTRD